MPGVPPDAVERVKGLAKRTLKGFFSRRNKDKPQEQQQPASATTASTSAPPPPPAKTAEQTQAQTPAITTTTNTLPSASTAPDTGKDLPPAGPQTTADAKDGLNKETPALPAAATATVLPTSDVKEDNKPSSVSPATSTAAAGNSEPVSALDESPPALPPKNDGSAAALKQIETPPANQENVAPIPTSTTTDTSKPATVVDDKSSEPPTTLVSVAAANATNKSTTATAPATTTAPAAASTTSPGGMSATSGPLEDYPIGAAKE